ncbi:MAG TPA: methylthioribulose 1-phosphate dehydratase [Alphaproteobacteria bacterium]|jgi:methylthioribulose-1-phosphate dehydratase|nr:methylthioribulose 1-phosphate dehydratase [Alphaproteobacteria bacterium]
MKTPDLESAATDIVAAGRFIAGRGWAPATAGNYSVRIAGDRIAITASGIDKGALTPADVLTVDGHGRAVDGGKPSAETLLHMRIYRDRPDAGAVLHTHSVASTTLGMLPPHSDEIVFAGYEILKAFVGYGTHDDRLILPVVDNSQDMAALAETASTRLRATPRTPGYLIRGHGVYTWGPDMSGARRHLEALEFLFGCELARRRTIQP